MNATSKIDLLQGTLDVLILKALSRSRGNVSEAARRLGIHRRSLQRKLRKRAPE